MARSSKGIVSTTTSGVSSGIATATAPRSTGAKSPTYDQIAQRAREIWTKKGCLPGQDEQNWLEAERQLRAELSRK